MSAATIDPDNAPLVVLELIQQLKIRSVMNRRVFTVARRESLRRAQLLMKTHDLRMVPVAETGRLFGVISMGDIIAALDGRYIHEICGLHMRSHVVALENDMPLSFAITYFGRYGFNAFPVLNRARLLVGTVSMRDVNQSLLAALSRELQRLERDRPETAGDTADGYYLREFRIESRDFANAGKASNTLRRELTRRACDRALMRRIAVAAYELEMNLVVHSDGGTLSVMIGNGRVEITARDDGPGITDINWALRDGTTTADDWIRSLGFGAGMGLPNVQRAADDFDLRSGSGRGTVARAVIHLAKQGDST